MKIKIERIKGFRYEIHPDDGYLRYGCDWLRGCPVNDKQEQLECWNCALYARRYQEPKRSHAVIMSAIRWHRVKGWFTWGR